MVGAARFLDVRARFRENAALGVVMSVDPNSIWYLARDGAIIWQGSASAMRSVIANGEIRGNEAAWSEGFDAWVSVATHEHCAWIRQAVAEHDELTGLHTEFSTPEGTAALNLPNDIDEGESPFAGPRPGRQRRTKGGRRATDHPGASGKAGRRGSDRRVISLVGLPVGLLAGIAIGLGGAYLAWTQIGPPQAVQPSPTQIRPSKDASVMPTRPTTPASDIEQPAANPVLTDATPTAKNKPKTVTAKDTGVKATTKKPNDQPQRAVPAQEPTTAPKGSSPIRRDTGIKAAQPSSVRIIKKKTAAGVQMPSDSQNREAEIQRSMKVRKGIWDACIRRAQRDYPALVGRLVFTISVTAQGTINGVTGPAGNAGAQYAAGCLLGEFSNLTYPPGRPAQVRFPYTTP